MPDADLLDLLQRLAVGLGLGFLIGVERGFRHRDAPEGSRAAGLRTHAIIGLMGGVCGALMPIIGQIGFAALTLAFAAALIVFKVRESMADKDLSVTGTLAALLLFALAAYAMWGDLRVAAAAGVALVALLALKDVLHSWLDKLTLQELRSALLILAASAIVLPVLPNNPLDPWGAVNPRELWLLTIVVAGASFAGYVAVRVMGGEAGLLVASAAGALVSSTVVTAELGRRVRAGQCTPAKAAAAACLAAAVSITRAGLFVSIAASASIFQAGPALAAGVVVFLAGGWTLDRLGKWQGGDATQRLQSPLDLRSVIAFALLLATVIAGGRALADAYGDAGLMPFAAAAGLADVDAVALAVGSLMRHGLGSETGAHAVLIAVLANTLAKGGIAAVTGGWRYGGLYLGVAAVAALAASLLWRLAAPL